MSDLWPAAPPAQEQRRAPTDAPGEEAGRVILILRRYEDESVVITMPDGTVVEVMVTRDATGYLALGFKAPRSVRIVRKELLAKKEGAA